MTEPIRQPVLPLQERSPGIREIDSQQLLHGDRSLVIRHGSELYRLSVTRNGKLILQK